MIHTIQILEIYNVGSIKFIRGNIYSGSKIYNWVATKGDVARIISCNFSSEIEEEAREAVLSYVEGV